MTGDTPPASPAALKVGRLPTMNDDEYPGLGAWWVQIWDGERVVARCYGDTPEEARAMAQRFAATPPASPAEPTERERLYGIAKAGGNWYAAAKPLPDEAFDALATPPAPAATDEEVDAASPVREQIHSAIRAFTSATVAEADAAALAIIRIIRNAAPRGVRWPPKGYERGQSGGFDGPTGAD